MDLSSFPSLYIGDDDGLMRNDEKKQISTDYRFGAYNLMQRYNCKLEGNVILCARRNLDFRKIHEKPTNDFHNVNNDTILTMINMFHREKVAGVALLWTTRYHIISFLSFLNMMSCH